MDDKELLARIIPADAGSTKVVRHRFRHPEDHPRGCGEHFCLPSIYRQAMGSSPRMRGALLPRRRRCHQLRIIPADAGSTT